MRRRSQCDWEHLSIYSQCVCGSVWVVEELITHIRPISSGCGGRKPVCYTWSQMTWDNQRDRRFRKLFLLFSAGAPEQLHLRRTQEPVAEVTFFPVTRKSNFKPNGQEHLVSLEVQEEIVFKNVFRSFNAMIQTKKRECLWYHFKYQEVKCCLVS